PSVNILDSSFFENEGWVRFFFDRRSHKAARLLTWQRGHGSTFSHMIGAHGRGKLCHYYLR
ncbi:MAG TPA: hypothetical protein VK667_07260, partial [Ktedonobacteraceae bacterium]|nr:hypothetical protein [Ktedonobacteraceae bacterium]